MILKDVFVSGEWTTASHLSACFVSLLFRLIPSGDSETREIGSSDLGEIRTLDPLIKSQLLYQLSYEV